MDTKEFETLKTDVDRMAYAAEQVSFWRGVQRKLYRIAEAETSAEKTAIAAKLTIVETAIVEEREK